MDNLKFLVWNTTSMNWQQAIKKPFNFQFAGDLMHLQRPTRVKIEDILVADNALSNILLPFQQSLNHLFF